MGIVLAYRKISACMTGRGYPSSFARQGKHVVHAAFFIFDSGREWAGTKRVGFKVSKMRRIYIPLALSDAR